MKFRSLLVLILTAVAFAPGALASKYKDRTVASEVNESQIKTPDEALKALQDGNKRFVSRQMLTQDFKAQKLKTAAGQTPYATVLSCLDSRIPPEIVFDQGIGDIFVGRVAGNVENRDMLGSFEFATQVVGTKALVVLGHTKCGAVIGACKGVELGNLTGLLGEIKPAIQTTKTKHKKVKEHSDKYHDLVSEENVRQTIADIRSGSPVMAKLESEGKLKIVGAMYNIDTGEVTWLK